MITRDDDWSDAGDYQFGERLLGIWPNRIRKTNQPPVGESFRQLPMTFLSWPGCRFGNKQEAKTVL